MDAYKTQNLSDGIESILENFIFNDSSSIGHVTIVRRGSYLYYKDSKVYSRMDTHPKDWGRFFHPLYGLCVEYQNQMKPKDMENIGTAGVQSFRIGVDFKKAFPDVPRKRMSFDTLQDLISINQSSKSVLVILYDRGSFYTSKVKNNSMSEFFENPLPAQYTRFFQNVSHFKVNGGFSGMQSCMVPFERAL